jgi:MOSC domain-containing protein YiiM
MSDTGLIRIKHLFISPGHNFFGHYGQPPGEHPTVERAEVKVAAGRGIEGDRFFDFKPGYNGQITFFASEVFDQICAEFGVWDRSASVLRRNVITAGVDLNALIGKEFEVQGVRFLGRAECSPCEWMDQAFAPGAEARLRGHGGLRAKVLTDGVLRVG